MKYIKESIFGDKFNKKIKDFLEQNKSDFKSEVDECMFDILDEFKHTSKFDLKYHEDVEEISSSDLCLSYDIEFNRNDNIELLKEGLMHSIFRLASIGTSFTISVSSIRITSVKGDQKLNRNGVIKIVDDIISGVLNYLDDDTRGWVEFDGSVDISIINFHIW